MAITVIGKTKEEIRAQYDKYTYLRDTVAFKTVGANGDKTAVRLSYHYSRWSNRSEKETIKWCTYWLIFTGDRCTKHVSNKTAAMSCIGTGKVNCIQPKRKVDPTAIARFEQTMKEEFPGDKGNCVLRAVTNVTGLPYAKVREVAMRYGYNPKRGGMRRPSTYAMLNELGFKHEDCTTTIREHARTLRTLDRKKIKGIYLIHVKGHCTSMINGTVLDHGWDRTRPIQKVSRIVI